MVKTKSKKRKRRDDIDTIFIGYRAIHMLRVLDRMKRNPPKPDLYGPFSLENPDWQFDLAVKELDRYNYKIECLKRELRKHKGPVLEKLRGLLNCNKTSRRLAIALLDELVLNQDYDVSVGVIRESALYTSMRERDEISSAWI